MSPGRETAHSPVVFLHGWGGSARGTWTAFDLLARLRRAGHPCLAPDLPGHGLNGGSHDPEAYDSIVQQVADQLPDVPVDLVGFSLGAKIALAIAVRSPGRVRRMVLAGVGDNVFSPEPAGQPMRELMTTGIGSDAPLGLRTAAVYALQSGGDRHAMAACLNRNSRSPTPRALRALQMPILLANGEEDTVIRDVVALTACLETAEVHRMPGIDHLSTPFAVQFHDLAFDFLTKRVEPVTPSPIAAEESDTSYV